jgi:hypothetical protein
VATSAAVGTDPGGGAHAATFAVGATAPVGAADATTLVGAGADVGASRATCSSAGSLARTPADATSKLDVAVLRTQAKAALTGLGWKPAIAHAAVAAAVAMGADMTLESLIFDALRRCPAPKA